MGCFTPSALRPTGLGDIDPKLKMGELEMPKGVRHCTVKLLKKKSDKEKEKKNEENQICVKCMPCVLQIPNAKFDMCKWKINIETPR